MSPEPLLTQREVADILRVSRRTVVTLTAQGRLRAVHPTPGRTCYTQQEVRAYIASLRRVA